MPEIVQMGQRLAHGKCHLMRIQRALEKNGENVGGRQWLGLARFHDVIQPFFVMGLQLLDALVQAGKWLAMRGQHQRCGGAVPDIFPKMTEKAAKSRPRARRHERSHW